MYFFIDIAVNHERDLGNLTKNLQENEAFSKRHNQRYGVYKQVLILSTRPDQRQGTCTTSSVRIECVHDCLYACTFRFVCMHKLPLPSRRGSHTDRPCDALQITADPYFHVRNASDHGALSVLNVMFKYRDDLRVLGVGLQRMAGSLLEGEATI